MTECTDLHTTYVNLLLIQMESQLGVREKTRNRGPEVDLYSKETGFDPGDRNAWCMIFVLAMLRRAAREAGGKSTCPRTANASRSYILARQRRLLTYTPLHVKQGIILPQPGDQFVRTRRGKPEDVERVDRQRSIAGHTGLVYEVHGGTIFTIEGNTNDEGSREGDGVYKKTISLNEPEYFGFVRHTVLLEDHG